MMTQLEKKMRFSLTCNTCNTHMEIEDFKHCMTTTKARWCQDKNPPFFLSGGHHRQLTLYILLMI